MESPAAEGAVSRAGEALRDGKISKALSEFDSAIAASPTAKSYSGRSAVHLAGGRPREAAEDAERAIAMDNLEPKGYLRLAQARRMQGNPEAARAAAEQGLSVAPKDEGLASELQRVKDEDGRTSPGGALSPPGLGKQVLGRYAGGRPAGSFETRAAGPLEAFLAGNDGHAVGLQVLAWALQHGGQPWGGAAALRILGDHTSPEVLTVRATPLRQLEALAAGGGGGGAGAATSGPASPGTKGEAARAVGEMRGLDVDVGYLIAYEAESAGGLTPWCRVRYNLDRAALEWEAKRLGAVGGDLGVGSVAAMSAGAGGGGKGGGAGSPEGSGPQRLLFSPLEGDPCVFSLHTAFYVGGG